MNIFYVNIPDDYDFSKEFCEDKKARFDYFEHYGRFHLFAVLMEDIIYYLFLDEFNVYNSKLKAEENLKRNYKTYPCTIARYKEGYKLKVL